MPRCEKSKDSGCVWTERADIVDARIDYRRRSEDHYYFSFSTSRGELEARLAYGRDAEKLAAAWNPVRVTGLGAEPIAIDVPGSPQVITARHPDFASVDHLVFGAAFLGFGLMGAVGMFTTRANRPVPQVYIPPLVRPRFRRDVDPTTGGDRWTASPALLVRFQLPVFFVSMITVIANFWSDLGPRGLATTAVVTALVSTPMYVGGASVSFDPDALRFRGNGVTATLRRWAYGSRSYYGHEHPRIFVEDGDVEVHAWARIYHLLNSMLGESPARELDVHQLVIAARAHGVVEELERRFDAGSVEDVATTGEKARARAAQPAEDAFPRKRASAEDTSRVAAGDDTDRPAPRRREDSGWSMKDHFYELWMIPTFIGVAGVLGVFGIGMMGEGKSGLTGDALNLVWAIPTTALGLWLTWHFDERKGGEPWPQVARFAAIHVAITAAVAIAVPLLFD